ncbi:4-hydroxythreonine-4-phosphate dehydrogenase PdxA [Prosthecochloris sp. N3]|uniref:4-hydroxythreonine-4-phosphate dehydrogenase PdxA n=1 Tax=Prosthecochloris ethylica TaxID=2743976 RepID=A0ABR9XRN0_9CHLB|nr:4-hydroxythreonine-4-phosphate dehydrogenase PdxA [Prosthecochloris ethylica]MBF0586743.1 4-hydroxythreonine-4-phosphate dehydrogenase PdxA [Prosthecochloris ethylica]MBF0636649.1 4-hydroxythreonine-4-phosphate dehydrogenase PdxA [Prosthecochloris ethylica]NUK47952.1 4-hydroxythreonine-4-phosphate dehydrogenase PdxA [Prosthecochloris ethylica]
MLIAWTIGDINGTGPEIILKSFREFAGCPARPVVIGSRDALCHYRDRYNLDIDVQTVSSPEEARRLDASVLPVISTGEPPLPPSPGMISESAGEIAMTSVRTAVELCMSGHVHAMVTAPIHKEAVSRAGYAHSGHTGYLAELCDTPSPTMLFHDPLSGLNVALATIHVPLRSVPGLVTSMDLERFIRDLRRSLQTDFGITDPSIALLGLNPHASDGGVMGDEEQNLLEPLVESLSGEFTIDGPFAADGFFGAKRYTGYDVTVAMYHDQGLLPFKVLAFDTGINVTLGLPIVRTSPDHGTGFDIAGTGAASPRSFTEAARLAATIARNRQQTNQQINRSTNQHPL